jgi:hypothetical protein
MKKNSDGSWGRIHQSEKVADFFFASGYAQLSCCAVLLSLNWKGKFDEVALTQEPDATLSLQR